MMTNKTEDGGSTPFAHNPQDDLQQIPDSPVGNHLQEMDMSVNFSYDDGEKGSVNDKNICSYYFRCRRGLKRSCLRHDREIKVVLSFTCLCLYVAYFAYALYLHHGESMVTGLIVITVILTLVILYKKLPYQKSLKRFQKLLKKHPRAAKYFKRFIAIICVVITCITLVTEVILVRPSNLLSLTGIGGMLALFLVTSTNPHKIKWRPVICGLLLQYMFALIVLKVPAVFGVFQWCGDMLNVFLSFSKAGAEYIYGTDFTYTGVIFQIVPLIAFVMCVLTILEHLMVLHAVLRIVGRILALCIGVSPAEALNAAANIFLGPIDSLIIIRPFLEDVTPSELHCLMANGMSTVTGSIMGLYIILGISADHLLAASVMSAPAALCLSKLAVPETRIRRKDEKINDHFESQYQSVMEAASTGAVSALAMSAAIISNITAVVSVMAMVNNLLSWLGELVNFKGLSLQWISSYLFYPLALSLGVDVQDGRQVAELLGVKIFINEVVAYTTLGQYRRNRATFEEYITLNYTDWSTDSYTNDVTLHGWNKTLIGGLITKRSEVISTYALCGFANLVCVGVMMGCYVVLVPHKKETIFKYILRSMVVGHCASFLTACIAGLLYK